MRDPSDTAARRVHHLALHGEAVPDDDAHARDIAVAHGDGHGVAAVTFHARVDEVLAGVEVEVEAALGVRLAIGAASRRAALGILGLRGDEGAGDGLVGFAVERPRLRRTCPGM